MNATEIAAGPGLARLRGREEIAAGTSAFHFAKPPGFRFKPGQAVELLLPDPAGGEAEIGHAFSLVNAPFEDELVIATRMRDSVYKRALAARMRDSVYKRALAALAPGASARLDGPFGSLTLHKDRTRPAVLVAGGIGITPFMSMLRQLAHDGAGREVVLLYSNRRPEDAAFLDELTAMARSARGFRLVATMTDMAHSTRPWHGQTGPLDAAAIREAIGGLAAPIAYVAGPPAMVEAMRGALAGAGVDEDDVRSEDFFGY
jgi:ferredoxin-NADP reductase